MAKQDKDDGGFDAVMDMWKQGQEAFLKAQEQVSEQFTKSLKDMGDFGGSSKSEPFEAWQNMIKSWMPVWKPEGSSQSFPQFDGLDFSKGQGAFFELLDPQKWTAYAPEQLRVMLERIAQGPQFADLAMPQQKAAEAWRETLDYQQAASDMSRVMQKAWKEAYEVYSEKYTLEDLQTGNVNEALDTWLQAANKSLLAAQGSDEFLDAQKRMIRSSTEIRARQRDMAEEWSAAWQMPTRSEVDDLAQIVHQLRRELRQAKREIERLKGQAG